MDRRPFEVERREEGKDWIYVLTKADEMPVSLSLIASGALGHLRAALDNLAYQLVLKSRSGAAPDWRVTFPISSAANKYAERRDGMLKGVDSQVLAVVDALEPYRDGKGKALWQLTELANLDKHRVLIPGRHYHAFVDMAPEFRELTNDYFGSDWPLPIPAIPVKPADGTMELGSVLFRQKENARSPHAEKVEFGFECRIDAPHIVDGESAIRTIVRCADSVRDAVNSFRQFFPS